MVIGGGATGSGVAWDLTLRGLNVILVEMGDVARHDGPEGDRPGAGKTIVDAWPESEFGGGSSTRKVAKMEEVDRRYHGAPAAFGGSS